MKKTGLMLVGVWAMACGGAKPEANTAKDVSTPADESELLADADSEARAPASSSAVKQGITAIEAGDFARAETVLLGAVAEDAADPQAAFYLGVAQAGLGKNEEAVSSLQRALKLQPVFQEASLNLSALLLDAGEEAEALRVVDAALAADPKATALIHNKALALLQLGKPDEAARLFEAVIAEGPASDEVRFLYAQSLLQAGETEPALAELRKLLGSESVEVLASVADLFGRLKQWPDCVSALDRAIAKRDASELHVKRGLCLHGASDEGEAKLAFERAIALDPKSASAHFYLGHNLRASGDKRAAKSAFLQAAELAGESKMGQAARAAAEKL